MQASAKARFPQDGTYNYFQVPIKKVGLMQTVANAFVETIGAHSHDDVIMISSRPHPDPSRWRPRDYYVIAM